MGVPLRGVMGSEKTKVVPGWADTSLVGQRETANRIRRYLLQKVDVARRAGTTELTLRAGDVHEALGMMNGPRQRLPGARRGEIPCDGGCGVREVQLDRPSVRTGAPIFVIESTLRVLPKRVCGIARFWQSSGPPPRGHEMDHSYVDQASRCTARASWSFSPTVTREPAVFARMNVTWSGGRQRPLKPCA